MDVIIAFIGSAFLGSMITALWRKLEGNGTSTKVVMLESEITHLRTEISDLKRSIDSLEKMLRDFLMEEYRRRKNDRDGR